MTRGAPFSCRCYSLAWPELLYTVMHPPVYVALRHTVPRRIHYVVGLAYGIVSTKTLSAVQTAVHRQKPLFLLQRGFLQVFSRQLPSRW